VRLQGFSLIDACEVTGLFLCVKVTLKGDAILHM